MDLLQCKTDEFLDRLAARAPTPGGGSALALSAALGASLARMVVAYSLHDRLDPSAKTALTELAESLGVCDQLLRALVSRDAEAYAAWQAARKLEKSEPGRHSETQRTVLAAIAVPIEIATVCGQILEKLKDRKELLNRFLLSDLRIAAGLLHAATAGSEPLVLVNVRELDDPRLRERILGELRQTLIKCDALAEVLDAYGGQYTSPT